MSLSIIIPSLNEQAVIHMTLNKLQKFRCANVEVIVVDGGSTDSTLSLIDGMVDQVLICESGRAMQMNYGAKHAHHHYLLFLHADSRFGNDSYIEKLAMAENNSRWGFHAVQLQPSTLLISIVEVMMNARSWLTKIATGDQAIWVSRSLFEQVGGYDNIALMEDISISKKLKAIEQPSISQSKVISSSRRWLQQGILRTIIKMWWFRAAYFCGVSPTYLAKKYKHAR